jgi:hypothetical protein
LAFAADAGAFAALGDQDVGMAGVGVVLAQSRKELSVERRCGRAGAGVGHGSDRHPQGLANSSDLVGRNEMVHGRSATEQVPLLQAGSVNSANVTFR